MIRPESAEAEVDPGPPVSAGTEADEHALPQRSRLTRNLLTVGMIWRREMIRLTRSRARIVTGLAQPLLFLFVLGAGLSEAIGARGIPGLSYQEFLFPGILGMSVLYSAMFSAISIVWDREFGFLREMLVAPVSRSALVTGKAIGGASQAVAQGVILLLAAPFAGISLDPLEIVQMLGLLLLLAFAIVSFGIVIATRTQGIEGFQMVMTLVAQPMFFLSGAIFPLAGLPTWLHVLSRVNPMSYGIDPVRRVILGDFGAMTLGGKVLPIWSEALIILGFGTGMLMLAVRMFSREG